MVYYGLLWLTPLYCFFSSQNVKINTKKCLKTIFLSVFMVFLMISNNVYKLLKKYKKDISKNTKK
jgi:hypothetical protein